MQKGMYPGGLTSSGHQKVTVEPTGKVGVMEAKRRGKNLGGGTYMCKDPQVLNWDVSSYMQNSFPWASALH